MIPLDWILGLSALMFLIGTVGVLDRKSVV